MERTPATLDELRAIYDEPTVLALEDVRQAAVDAATARIDLERVMRRVDKAGVSRRGIALAAGFSPAGVGKILRRKGTT